MKIGAGTISITPLPAIQNGGVPSVGKGFSAILEEIKKGISPILQDISASTQEISSLQKLLHSKKGLSAQELLGYQLKVSELGLKTELFTKAADSALAVTRKLQNNG